VVGNSEIWFKDSSGNATITPIGPFVDKLLKDHESAIVHVPENRTEYLDVSHKKWTVPAFELDGLCGFYSLLGVSRHLPVGDLVKIVTESGRSVTATQQKSFIKWDEKQNVFIDCHARDLHIGDHVPVSNQIFSLVKCSLDPIISIEYIKCTDQVYDLTVDGPKTFFLSNGLALRDTFHLRLSTFELYMCLNDHFYN